MPDVGSKRNRSSVNLLLFFDLKHKSHQNSQIHGAPVVLTAPMRSYNPEYWPYQIQELQGGLEGIFPVSVVEVIPKSILQFSADIRTYTKSPPYLIACLLAPSLNFV